MDYEEKEQEFSLDDILREFRSEDSDPIEDAPTQVQSAPVPEDSPPEAAPLQTEQPAEPTTVLPQEAPVEDNSEQAVVTNSEPPADTQAADSETADSAAEDTVIAATEAESEAPEEGETEEDDDEEEDYTLPPKIVTLQTKLQELKKKLVAGPEKRYYDLSEIGVGKLQLSIFLNLIIFLMCVALTTMFQMGMIRDGRLRFIVFSQVLAMLASATLGCHVMLEGLGDILRGRFTMNTLLTFTFAACCADAYFCLTEVRIPCCSCFTLEMTFALLARYHRRTTEMSQLDTLRKAVRLISVGKEKNVFEGHAAILRGEGDVDDFMDTYRISTTPQRLQCVYAFLSLVISLGIAALAGMRHSPSVAVQVLSTSLLVAAPASFFVSLTRPTAILEKRLHLVGSVICGWQGVRGLCGKAAFPITDKDLFPNTSTKLNGIKFYGKREPEQVLSYTTSLISYVGSGLEGVFRNMMKNRGGQIYEVTEFRDYGRGGIGGIINNEAVLLGSLDFIEQMGVEIPQGTAVSQAVYAAVNGELSAVIAISYSKMRSSAAGLVSIAGHRRLIPVILSKDFMITPDFLHNKFGVNTRRYRFPDPDIRQELSERTADPEAPVYALSTHEDLAGIAYTVTGSSALRTACRLGMLIHIFGGILGLLIMLALAYLGEVEYLSPTRILLYQLIWGVPGLLVTEWTRTV